MFLSASKLMLDANEESILQSVICNLPVWVAALTSLLIACCTIDAAQFLTAHPLAISVHLAQHK
jgi:hypothetical protein